VSVGAATQSASLASEEPGTLWDFIQRAIMRYADSPALALRDGELEIRWSYRELGEQIEAAAARLAAEGLGRGDRVLLWGANRPHWGTAFFSLFRLGAVVVPLDVRSAPDFVQRVAERTGAKALLADRDLLRGFRFDVGTRISIDEVSEHPHPGPSASSGQAPSARSGQAPAPHGAAERGGASGECQAGPDDLVEIVYTSGTTGEPKGVMITNRNLLANVHAIDRIVHLEPGWRLVSLLPLSHLFEQTVGLMDVLGSGACTVYLHSLKPASILDAIHDEQATAMLVVPQVLDLFLEGIEREVRRAGKQRQWQLLHVIARWLPFGLRRHLFRPIHERFGGRFQFFVTGGAALDPALGYRWENMGIKIVQGYGVTEAAPGVAVNRLDDRSMETVGWALEGIDVSIADDAEILIRGPQVTPGYWDNPRATAAAFEDGWYRTGDLGEFDGRGRLRLRGRKNDMIVLANGMNVYPEDVESVLRLHPAVKDAVVVGLKRGRSEVDVHAVLLLHDAALAGDALKAANKQLSAHQQIRGHTLWPDEDFPRTLTLKARRPLIEERLRKMAVGEPA
jgi:long-chain acyl-CoA synthetase